MFFRLTFKHFSEGKKLKEIRERGILLGSRSTHGRKVFLYMIRDVFAEVLYAEDDIDAQPEKIEVFSNLHHLNHYLEREFRTAF
jgi:hypothetical protein